MHNNGLAIDLRGNDKTEAENTRLEGEIRSRLEESYGDDIYDVIFEDYDGANDVIDHIHIEFDPKFPPALRQDMDAVKGDAYGYCPKN